MKSQRNTLSAARGYGKGFQREGRCLPSENQPSSYLVNKDILLRVIPAEQDGVLGVMGKALSSTEASLGAHSQDGPSLSTAPVPASMMGPWELEEQATRAPKASAKRSTL